MKLKEFTKLFQLILLIMGILGLCFLLFLVPQLEKSWNLNFSVTIVKWFLWLTGIPVYYILGVLWKISYRLNKKQVFSKENSNRLRYIAYASVVESVLYAVAIITMLINSGESNYLFLFLSLFFFFLGLMLALASTLFFYIFQLAQQIQSENDLTI